MTAPRATLRLQFHKGFTFADAMLHIDYFAALGVSHIYASPILKARAGSIHGYDIVDHRSINPELGGEDGLRRFVAALRERDLGFIADIVPNHMCVSDSENLWWNDVLEWGADSAYAGFFDIDWQSRDPALRNKIHLPFLGEPYGEALANGNIDLAFDPQAGQFSIRHYEHRFPVAPSSHALIEELGGSLSGGALAGFDPGTADGLRNLHLLLEVQHYRLAWWRTAADEINWRRFFDITDLAGLRIEQRNVFEATHALMLNLYAEGVIDGFRVDHIDGLADPRTYCRRLRRYTDILAKQRPASAPKGRAWILVEKILGAGERLPSDWSVDGTTGYDFMDEVSGLLHNARGEAPLTSFWTEMTGDRRDFRSIAKSTRRLILDENLYSERDKVVNLLHRLARLDPATRDCTIPMLRRALTELLVHFSVYRSYATLAGRSEEDNRLFAQAIADARGELLDADGHILDLINDWLGGAMARGRVARAAQRRAIVGFQQLSSALTAKAVEDTAFYRYGRLLSRNEVGSSPADFAYERDRFHAACVERQRNFPRAMLATATHDHKRGEDARMRLATLSEIPDRWAEAVRRWTLLNASFRASLSAGVAPEPGDEIMLYETLVGAWPVSIERNGHEWLVSFRERILGWFMKSIREAKRRSRWIAPDEAYEEAARAFVEQILDPAKSEVFLTGMNEFVDAIAPAAAINSLVQTFLRMTTPGIPDLYQGAEFWDLSLVDPDNRRPVDFRLRAAALAEANQPADLLGDWMDGRIKQALIASILAVRAEKPSLFSDGKYQPLTLQGAAAVHAIAFARAAPDGEDMTLALASRFPTELLEDGKNPLIAAGHWKETSVVLPAPVSETYRDALTNRRHTPVEGTILLRDIFSELPVALLLPEPARNDAI
ncbi:MAG TPA: malto-oligosyltrehalose synthase [Parvibaculum sp.]|jgi:(1->4)-alpha-D-glucan 1-alpha-D-glucosylmutase